MDIQYARYIESLIEKLRAKVSDLDREILEPFLLKFESGGFSYDRESWHETGSEAETHSGMGELLLRFDSDELKLQTLTNVLRHPEICYLFDQLVVTTAIRQAMQRNQFPVSINISARNATDRDMLLGLHAMLRQTFGDSVSPAQIIFEFLEDDPADNPCTEALHNMRALGYRFAIDDLSHLVADRQRLKNLGPYVDYIKIDGDTLKALRDDETRMRDFLTLIHQYAPQAKILAEWVKSPEEAAALARAFPQISFVQGRRLAHTPDQFREQFDKITTPKAQ